MPAGTSSGVPTPCAACSGERVRTGSDATCPAGARGRAAGGGGRRRRRISHDRLGRRPSKGRKTPALRSGRGLVGSARHLPRALPDQRGHQRGRRPPGGRTPPRRLPAPLTVQAGSARSAVLVRITRSSRRAGPRPGGSSIVSHLLPGRSSRGGRMRPGAWERNAGVCASRRSRPAGTLKIAEGGVSVSYRLEIVGEVRDWLHALRRTDRASAIQVGRALTALLDECPGLGRPPVDRIKGSRLHNLKERVPRLGRDERSPHPVRRSAPRRLHRRRNHVDAGCGTGTGVFPVGVHLRRLEIGIQAIQLSPYHTRVPQRPAPYAWTRPLISWQATVPATFRIKVSHRTQEPLSKSFPTASGLQQGASWRTRVMHRLARSLLYAVRLAW